ncbi:hypothetical protein [Methanobrevibacter filiformis]|uniref:Uncharacterized protein n=1 Tax=Methanobrevibacter filiformis TaxID=55758 RepID=A0A166C915_9EURY|nr:hypothetical protein [Methanobrevibacter filiformis]KZX12347.1 hypothetical protein MBFIL_11520 [Methanobrevibacter filiformis]
MENQTITSYHLINEENSDVYDITFLQKEEELYVTHSHTFKVESEWINPFKSQFDEISERLSLISNKLDLGEVTLVEDEDELYPPTFHISADSYYSAEKRVELYNCVVNQLYSYYEKQNNLDTLVDFFIVLDF